MEEKLRNIIDKVSCIYMKYGIKSVTMDDISRELGISKKTLYGLFNDKNDLVRQFMVCHIEAMAKQFDAVYMLNLNAIDTLMEISKLITVFLQGFNPSVQYDLQKYHTDVWQMLLEYKRNHVYNKVKENIEKGIKQGLYRSDLNPYIIARIYVMRIELSMESDNIPEFSSIDVFNELLSYHVRGIASEKGIAHYEKITKTNSK